MLKTRILCKAIMDIKLFDADMLSALDAKAQNSPRRRSNYNVHDDMEDPVQRLFITLYPDSFVRPHRHSQENKWEFFLMISGELSFLLFDEDGICTGRHELSANGNCRGLEVPPHVWHCIAPGSEPATFFEVKMGPYAPIDDKDFASWSPKEGEANAAAFQEALKLVQPGEKVELK